MIPRTRHVIWVGDSPMPDRYRRYLDCWAEHNPHWRVELWTDTNRPTLRNERVYRSLQVPALRADVLRLELLARHGGLYSDADSVCLRLVDELVEGAEAVAMTGRRGHVCVATMAAIPENPAFVALVEGLTARYDRLRSRPRNSARGWSVHRVAGTRYVHPTLSAAPGFRMLPHEVVCERPDATDRTVIVHDHAESWRAQLGGRKVRL